MHENIQHFLIFLFLETFRGAFAPGGHWPRKGVWGCAAVMTPFFQASRRSLAYQFTIIAPLLCPPFSNFRKIFHFQPCFGQNFSSQDTNFPNFCSLDPSFFKKNPLPRPYFWKPVWHTPTKKKVECPPPGFCPLCPSYGAAPAQPYIEDASHWGSLGPTRERVYTFIDNLLFIM